MKLAYGLGTRLLIVLLSMMLFASFVLSATGSIDVEAGHIYYAELTGTMDTLRWTGLIVQHTAMTLSDSKFPFLTGYSASFPGVVTVNFPGYNLEDGKHYYAATFADEFDILNVQDVQASDLEANGIFSQANFPTFYPDYYDFSDNPRATFTQGTLDTVTLNGVDFIAYNVTLENNVNYYLLKYNYLGEDMPLFLVRLGDATCVGGVSCEGEFMLPVSGRAYNFFVLSEIPLFNFEIEINSVTTDHFEQSAWPYLVWVRATDFYSGLPAPAGTDIFVRENNGNDLFIPYLVSGVVADAMSIGQTDANGETTFVIAPTIYPPITDYNMTLGAIVDGIETSETDLYVDEYSPMDYTSQSLSPSQLNDNVIRSVNTLDTLSNAILAWQNPSSGPAMVKEFTVVYDVAYDNFSIVQTGSAEETLRTGAPNMVTVEVESNGMAVNGYNVVVSETDGALVMSPYFYAAPLNPTTRKYKQIVPQSTRFIITPTDYGSLNPDVNFAIVSPSGDLLGNVSLSVDANYEKQAGEGVSYTTTNLIRRINSIDQVVKALFTVLNY